MPSKQASNQEGRLVNELDDRFRKLNKLWERAEKNLRRFTITDEVSVIFHCEDRYPTSNPNVIFVNSHLGFSNSVGGWRICVGYSCDDDESGERITWKPIVDCSADVRLNAIAALPQLKEQVVKAAAEAVEKLDSGIAEFQRLLTTL